MTQKNVNGPGNKNSQITNDSNKKPLNKNMENIDNDKDDDDDDGYTILPSNDSGITNDDNAIYAEPGNIKEDEEE